MFISKHISAEVIDLVYSKNNFTVRQGHPYSLKRLKLMGGLGLASLTSLTIRLDWANKHAWGVTDDDVFDEMPGPISISRKYRYNIFLDFQALIQKLSRSIRPQALKLYLIFCAWDFEDLEGILDCLEPLPSLKECGIWACLSKTPKRPQAQIQYDRGSSLENLPIPPSGHTRASDMESLVRETSSKLTRNETHPLSGFRYLGLPQELRLYILEYTDLISSEDVQWRPQKTLPPWDPLNIIHCPCWEYGGPSDLWHSMAEDHTCRLSETGWKERIRDIESWSYHSCCGECRSASTTQKCFCPPKGPVYSTTCQCLRARHPLFSVSREVREDAIATYYSYNRFIITSYRSPTLRSYKEHGHWPPWPSIATIRQVELSLYLLSITRNALQYIRWLEWILPISTCGYLQPKSPAWFDFLDTLDMMAHSMNIPNLTFVLNMTAAGTRVDSQDAFMPIEANCYHYSGRTALTIRRLGKLKDCFIYLGRYDDLARYNIHRRRQINWEREHRERMLEKAIMGPQYDSRTRGKPEERITRLAQQYNHHLPYGQDTY